MERQDNFVGFRDRLAVIATMHRKELAIAPILESSLGVKVIVPQDFNSDLSAHLLAILIARQIK